MSFVVGYAPTLGSLVREEYRFWNALDSVVTGVSNGDHLLVLMDVNARTGKRQSGWADSKVLGAYRRDELKDNGERLLHAADNKIDLRNTFFATTNRGVSYTFQSTNSGTGHSRLDDILTRQVDRRLVRNITHQRSCLLYTSPSPRD